MDEFSRRPRQVDGDGAAKRRRLRRLRSWWRHEQQTVAAVLATYQHHSAHGDRGRPGQWGERETNYTATLLKMLPPRRLVPGTLRWMPGRTMGEAPAAGRPAPLLEVLPQERVQRRTAEQIVDPVAVVPLLHDTAPQMVEQLVDFLTPLDFPVPEQVIDVPMIVCPPRAARTVSSPLTFQYALGVELVDVFKVFSLGSIPPCLIMVFLEVFKVFTQDRVQQRVRSSSLTFQFLMVARISKILVSHRFLMKLLGKRFKGFLALFPGGKKVRKLVRTRGRNCSPSRAHPRGQLIPTSSGRMSLAARGCCCPLDAGTCSARTRSFLGWPGMMGMEIGMGEAASRGPVASVVLASAYHGGQNDYRPAFFISTSNSGKNNRDPAKDPRIPGKWP